MTKLRYKIAQMLMMGFSGTALEPSDPVCAWLDAGLGGVILFDQDLRTNQPRKNIVDHAQLLYLNQQLITYAARLSDLPLLIAVDYEGGAVNRLRHLHEAVQTVSPEQYAKLSDSNRIALCQAMAKTLQTLKFNVNFAPVVDLAVNHMTGIIGRLGRSFSQVPEEVAQLAEEYMHLFAQERILGCYKHFPGHGSAMGDTHEGFADVSETFSMAELAPYYRLPKLSHPAMVMTAHVINRQLDADGLPATLSRPILEGLLRQKIGFQGIIISDDLQMGAIAQYYDLEDSLRLTINAGADMMIFGNQLGDHCALDIIDIIEHLVQQKKINESRIDEAFLRIRTTKAWLARQKI